MTFSVKELLYVLEVIRKRQDYRSASDLLMEFLNVYDALGDEKQKVYNKYEVPADETLFNEVAYRNETRKIESTYYSYLLPIYNKMTHPSEKEVAFIF
ncbi:hypothetical protein FIU87_19335 [Bacillus sp. THAF10]|uniref:hypothetical protein n=1 Tax=Bacillus sp. THAF10 TaxID=2587848 RepID=UPI0012697339|nr:hypothetical protein [Bacillus sp. THAF10]QFT90803.1 hypothetical protein FIU87_19335 [Bacillus sp. THAF10]